MSNDSGPNSVTLYFSSIRNHGLLTAERERHLARRLRDGCADSRNELVSKNLSFVAKVAFEYRNMGMPYEDLVSEGNLGLLEAADRFDPARGVRFLTYATWWIRKEILRALGQQSAMVRVPETQMRVVRELRHAEMRLWQELGRRPTREEVSTRIRVGVHRIETLLQACSPNASLDEAGEREADRPLNERVSDERNVPAVERLIDEEALQLVDRAISRLSERQQFIVRNRFGFTVQPMTLAEIGTRINLSRERVRQLETVALARLRRIFVGMRQIGYRPPERSPKTKRVRIEDGPRKSMGASGGRWRRGVVTPEAPESPSLTG